jgi:AcrR family transcriptional regulator
MSKSEITRQKLLDHALIEAVEVGPDRLGFTAVAKRSGMSTGALYSRYENVDELLIDLWEQRALPRLEAMTETFIASTQDGTRDNARKEMTAHLNAGDPLCTLVALLMVVGRRNEVLREVIEPDVRRIVDAARSRLATYPQMLASILGALLMIRGARVKTMEWSYFVSVLSSSCERGALEIIGVDPDYPRYSQLSFDGLDDFDHRLFTAAAEVIGRVGVDRSTISRIARTAGVNPAGIYARHRDKEKLLADLIAVVLKAVDEADKTLKSEFLDNKPIFNLMIQFQRAVVDPTYQSVRNLRLELIYAAGHHEGVRESMIGTHRALALRDEVGGRIADVQTNPSLAPFNFMGRALVYGNSLMLEYGYLGVDEPYVGSMAKHMVEELTDLYVLYAQQAHAE